MSQLLAPYYDSIPASYLPVQMQNLFVGNLTANGWQLLAQVDGSYSDVIPPATETIGTSKFREVVRIYFPDNVTVKIGSYQACIADAFAQSILVWQKTGGAVQAGVTIDGVSVLGAMGSAGSSSQDNLRALYYALKDSTNPTIQGWDYWYDGGDNLVCTNKTITTNKVCSGNANVNYTNLASSVRSGARSGYVNVDVNYAYGVTVDLTNGFVYYMDVFSRSFKLGTKCNSGSYGPVFAYYADHATALAAMPAGGNCTPIELIVGIDDEVSGKAYCRPTHWWAIPTRYSSQTMSNVDYFVSCPPYAIDDCHPFTGATLPRVPSDAGLSYWNGSSRAIQDTVIFREMGGSDAQSSSNQGAYQFKLVPVSSLGVVVAQYGLNCFSIRFQPPQVLADIYKWNGTEPIETSALGASVPVPGALGSGLTLQQALDDTTSYTTFTLSSTSGLNATGGGFFIGSEFFTYTGLSGTSPTGVQCAQEGTARRRHFVGDPVQPAMWFLKINGGAICSGNQKPS